MEWKISRFFKKELTEKKLRGMVRRGKDGSLYVCFDEIDLTMRQDKAEVTVRNKGKKLGSLKSNAGFTWGDTVRFIVLNGIIRIHIQ